MTPGRRPPLAAPLRLAALGGLLLLVAATALAVFQRHTVIAELEQESIVLHRLASQRADQHDAHMTALSAIAVAADGARTTCSPMSRRPSPASIRVSTRCSLSRWAGAGSPAPSRWTRRPPI